MTEFCENCPLRGKAIGCLAKLYMVNEVNRLNEDGEWLNILGNPAGVLEESNISKPFVIPDDPTNLFERVERKIAACERHVSLEETKLLDRIMPWRKRCPAIGELAISTRWLKELLISMLLLRYCRRFK